MATEPANILTGVTDRAAFRSWLAGHHATEAECWVAVRRGKPAESGVFYYLDAVEESLCFGWIDSTVRPIGGVTMQRFSPRRLPWLVVRRRVTPTREATAPWI